MLVPLLHGHYSLHHYYELVQPLISLLPNLGYKSLFRHTSSLRCFKSLILKNLWVLPGMLNITLIYSPCSIDPNSTFTISRINDIVIIVYGEKEHIDYYYFYLTGLDNFTFSHYGSYSCMPTLKPHLTTLAPRLTNGSLLEITMLGFHQLLYIKHRTGVPYIFSIAYIFLYCVLIIHFFTLFFFIFLQLTP